MSTTRRESAERENPSLPGVSGGVPLNPIDFSRVGGWEQPRPCCGENADATHRAQRPPTTPCNETQTAKRSSSDGRARLRCPVLDDVPVPHVDDTVRDARHVHTETS